MYSNGKCDSNNSLNDLYISISKRHIHNHLKKSGKYNNYQFCLFVEKNIKKALPEKFLCATNNRRCVLIASRAMLPLALFYYKRFSFVTCVLDAKDSISNITNTLFLFDGGKMLMPSVAAVPSLTISEIFILEYMLKDVSLKEIANLIGENVNTIYSKKKSIIKKMQLKRIEQLFI